MKYDEILVLNGQKLTNKYIASLSKEEREVLVDPITDMVMGFGLVYPDDQKKILAEWERIKEHQPDLTSDTIYNNSSTGTYICKYFCHDFFNSRGPKDKRTMAEIFKDRVLVRKLVYNRLGLEWIEDVSDTEGTFNLSPKMMIQGLRSMRQVSQISMFKPTVYKYLVLKYSDPEDLVFDYSCGWGGRMLATVAAGRKYLGVDPLTVPDLVRMRDYLKLDAELIQSGSEVYVGKENSIDFSCSSPPYFNQEVYSNDSSQAYSQGEDYFYNTYWDKTLKNIKLMLKPNKFFGLNIINYPKMLEMAKGYFGEPVEEIKLRTVRSHLNKAQGKEAQKYEPVFIFKNVKGI